MVVRTSSQVLLTHGKKIVAIGRNYAEHAKELGNKVPTEPFFFLKPTTSYIRGCDNSKIEIPDHLGKDTNVHHEIELGVVIGGGGAHRDVSEERAMGCIKGYILALDITERGLQNQAKQAGKPWSMAKGFDTFCPISDEMILCSSSSSSSSKPDSSFFLSPTEKLWCKVNGTIRQNGSIGEMIFPISKLISYISSVMTLEENDVILTGTPSGVGPIVPGDIIEGGLGGARDDDDLLLSLKFHVVARGKPPPPPPPS